MKKETKAYIDYALKYRILCGIELYIDVAVSCYFWLMNWKTAFWWWLIVSLILGSIASGYHLYKIEKKAEFP